MMSSSWAKSLTKFGRDGYNLARVVVQNRGSNVRPLLLEQAFREANTVATGLLKVDKEVGLVKYYGLSGYLKQRFQSTSTARGESSPNPDPVSSSSSPVGAKIAFMVTASMKQELSERLGYGADQIKTLTPLQASLILNESIQPEDIETKLPLAEQAYNIRRRQEEEEARIQAEQAHVLAAATTTTTTVAVEATVVHHDDTVVGGMGHATQHFGVGHGYRSRNELDPIGNSSSMGEFFSASEWFEVTEITADGSISRVGLYTDEEEAKLGMTTRREIAEAKKTNLKFDMHRIPSSTLEAYAWKIR